MKILGLTGSIGMGKSTAAAMMRRLGVPVHDADKTVHDLMAPQGAAVAAIGRAFPSALVDGRIDRQRLGALVFGQTDQLKILENILHPMVRAREKRFLACQRRRRMALVVLDVPLLFETGGQKRCDGVAVVSCPAFVQRARVLRRPGMTDEKLTQILSRQMPDGQKRRHAHWVVPSGRGRAVTFACLKAIIKQIRQEQSHA